MSGQIEEFPDPRNYDIDTITSEDGIVVFSDNIKESGIIANRDKWRLYPSFEIVSIDQEKHEAIFKSSDGILFKMPDDPVTVYSALYMLSNPGQTVEDVVSSVIEWLSKFDEGVMKDEAKMFRWGVYIMKVLALLWMYGLIIIDQG